MNAPLQVWDEEAALRGRFTPAQLADLDVRGYMTIRDRQDYVWLIMSDRFMHDYNCIRRERGQGELAREGYIWVGYCAGPTYASAKLRNLLQARLITIDPQAFLRTANRDHATRMYTTYGRDYMNLESLEPPRPTLPPVWE